MFPLWIHLPASFNGLTAEIHPQNLSVGKREAGLHVADIQHHPGEPDQEGDPAGHRRDPGEVAQHHFQKADLFHEVDWRVQRQYGCCHPRFRRGELWELRRARWEPSVAASGRLSQ